MQERVQKILAGCGVASRRKAEEFISAGRVTVNGEICHLGDTADISADEILLDGVRVEAAVDHVYIMLNKPRGYVTTMQDEKGRKTAAALVQCGRRVYPVGRLDMNSEGLLLFTDDGALTNRLLHPSHEISKTYLVRVSDYVPDAAQKLSAPMDIDGYRIRPAGVRVLMEEHNQALLEITIHEGRNRQIRKMAEQCGLRVLRLKRVREGNLSLGRLAPGTWRYLTDDELKYLKEL